MKRYVNRIRNKNKKKYAQKYLKWLQKGERGDSPEAEGIGIMAAQAVRLELSKFYSDKPEARVGEPPEEPLSREAIQDR